MARRKSTNNLRKRNQLIAKLIAAGAGTGDEVRNGLSEADRRAVAAAREVPVPHPVVSDQPLDVPGGWACGALYVYPNPVVELRDLVMPGESLNFGPLMLDAPLLLGKSPADILEHLLRVQRAATGETVPTVDITEFFDGNGDRASIAANIVGTKGGPSFELVRKTLLSIAKRRDVMAVGVEIGEFPNVDHPGDDDMWPPAARVFIWTTETVKAVRGWVKALHADDVARGDRKAVAAPDGKVMPAKIKMYAVLWD